MSYKCPQEDTLFILEHVLDFYGHYRELGFEDLNKEMMETIFDEFAKFTENEVAPLFIKGDEGCRWEDGNVTTPEGFKAAYHQYVEGGWPGMAQPLEFGGQGLPYSSFTTVSEWIASANHAWAPYSGLSQGCIETIQTYGTEQLKQQFLPSLVSGEWTGTMCLTEAHCGSDLGLLKTKAIPQGDGSYKITGTKIFITAGEHDMSDNIVHIVLARLPDAPAGTKGISLFVVPKYHVNESGEIQQRNDVNCGSIEHKMGIHGSATCVMNFDGAKGFLIGPPNKGLNCMFTFMNSARIGTGVEGLGASQYAYQKSLEYARERTQMRSVEPALRTKGSADPIIVHPDVRRMLLTQRALAEGNRAFAMYCMKQVDITLYADDAEKQQQAQSRLAFLTPILKAFATETAQEATYYGMQVYGGHGYIKEWGMEQLARDTRISTLYEGTTGIQAIDLIMRKVAGDGGQELQKFTTEIQVFCAQQTNSEILGAMASQLLDANAQWQELSQTLLAIGSKKPIELAAAAVDYLMYSGYVTCGYFWLQMAVAAQAKYEEDIGTMPFCQTKLHTAQFYMDRLMSRTQGYKGAIESGANNLMAIPEEWL